MTKLWNASKFGLMHLEDFDGTVEGKATELFDKWLLSKLHMVIKESTVSMEQFEYGRAKAAVENFFWHTFCDNYLEIVKDRLYNPQIRGATQRKKRAICFIPFFTQYAENYRADNAPYH